MGATFTVTLPMVPVSSIEALERSAVAERQSQLRGVRVLGVDDDEDTRELVLLAMRAAGAEVMVVSNPDSALEATTAFQPHVLVTDIAMAGMNGYTLVREVRKRSGAHAPIAIALSAYIGERDEERGQAAGFAAHLGKPIDFDRLVTVVAELVQQSRART
jgi:CheY-like chemotaxis protein